MIGNYYRLLATLTFAQRDVLTELIAMVFAIEKQVRGIDKPTCHDVSLLDLRVISSRGELLQLIAAVVNDAEFLLKLVSWVNACAGETDDGPVRFEDNGDGAIEFNNETCALSDLACWLVHKVLLLTDSDHVEICYIDEESDQGHTVVAVSRLRTEAISPDDVSKLLRSKHGALLQHQRIMCYDINVPGDRCVLAEDGPIPCPHNRSFLTQSFAQVQQPPEANPGACDVRKIMVDVVPGPHGMGVEIYARNNKHLEEVLSHLSNKVDLADQARYRAEAKHGELLRRLVETTNTPNLTDSERLELFIKVVSHG